ncbi:MAG TPA: hypothetical protein VFQ86_04775, partial [Arachidicoccus soli]|nr:hypothetical protein [Arachidicoccus soli]
RLYKQAYHAYFPSNRIFIKVKNPASLKIGNNWDSVKYKNAYCYELITSPTPIQKIRKHMQYDLDSFFGYKAFLEKKEIQCWILKNEKPFSPSNDVKPKNNFYKNGEIKTMKDQPLSVLVEYLNSIYQHPVINETNIKHNVDLTLPKDVSNIRSLKASLKRQGIKLYSSKRQVTCFMISD